MIPRRLEPEVMDTPEEAAGYDAMDHAAVNEVFVNDLLRAVPFVAHNQPLEVLDLGTGTAQIPIELCRRETSWTVQAIDLSQEMLKVAESNVRQAGLVDRIALSHRDAKQLDWPDDHFDIIMSNSIIHHIPKPMAVIKECRRLLKSGGILFLRDLLRPDSKAALEGLVTQYAGDATKHQKQMFRDSLRAALTLEELRGMLVELEMPERWAVQTTDRHWTVCNAMLFVEYRPS